MEITLQKKNFNVYSFHKIILKSSVKLVLSLSQVNLHWFLKITTMYENVPTGITHFCDFHLSK